MNVGTYESFLNLKFSQLIMVKNVAGWNKCGRLMKNMIPTNSGLNNNVQKSKVITVAAEGGLEPPPAFHKRGRAPPKIYVCDVINISWAVLVLVNYRREPDVL